MAPADAVLVQLMVSPPINSAPLVAALPLTVSASPVCALVRTTFAEVAVVTPGLPVLLMTSSVSVTASAAACSV